MKRLAVCPIAAALLLGLTGPAQAVPPNQAPAIYLLVALDENSNPIDIGAVQFDPIPPGASDGPCTLLWGSDGFAARSGSWGFWDYGQPGANLRILDGEAFPLWDIDPCFYVASADFLVGEGYNSVLWDHYLVLGIPLQ